MNIKKEIRLTAQTKADDGTIIAAFSASINTENPKKIAYTPAISNQELYKEHRQKVKEDQTLFEDTLYKEQEKMIAQMQEGENNEN